jgi:tetratricopeptide (TPR) repeat protein
MHEDLLKPIASLEFDPLFEYKEEFKEFLKNTRLFKVSSPCQNYYSEISSLLMKEENIADFILNNHPQLKGLNVLNICVSENVNYLKECKKSKEQIDIKKSEEIAVSQKQEGVLFVFNISTTESQFYKQALDIYQKYQNAMFTVLESNKGFHFYKKFLGFDPVNIKMHADALFCFKEYSKALLEYQKIQIQFPEYSCRMAGICKIILGNSQIYEEEALDVLLLEDRVDSIYQLSKFSKERVALEYWLSKKDVGRFRRMLVVYANFKNFLLLKNLQKTEYFLEMLKNEIEQKTNTSVEERKNLWADVYKRVETELSTENK